MSIRQVGLELRVEGEREATQALRRYVDASDKLKTSVLDAAGKLNSVNSRWQQANKLYDQGTLSAKALKAAQTQLARELAVLNGYMTKNGTANTNKALAELRAAEATRRNAQAQEEASRAAQAHAREVDQLAMKYKPLYAASKQYETALNELNRAHQIGALNSAQHRVEIDKLDAEYTQFLNGAARAGNRFSGHINQTSMRLNQMGVVTQQAGYQIGDFLVQVQSGTNPMVAFGQQATQLVGVMGMMNPKLIGLSAGLGIAIPLVTAIGAAFMRTNTEAQEAAQGVQEFEDRIAALDRTLKSWLETRRAAEAGLTVDEYIASQSLERALQAAIESRQKLINMVEEEILTAGLSGAISPEEYAEQYYASEFAAAEAAIEAARERLRLASEKVYDEVPRVLGTIVSDTVMEISGAIGATASEMGAIQRALDESEISMRNLRGIDISAGITPAVAAAQELARQLGISFRIAASLSGAITREPDQERLDPRSPRYDPQAARTERIRETMSGIMTPDRPAARASGGGRGGGSSRETATESQFLAALEAELAVKRKMIGASEQERAILERVNELQDQAIQKDLNISESRLRQFAEEELAIQRQLDMQATFSNNIERAMMAVVDGTASVEDAFKSMLRNIIMEIYQQQVAKPIASSIGGWISKLFGSANGNVFAGGGHVTAYANGGVVNGPTFFPMTGNKTGLMGEAGPEAIMPLTRTKNGKLGVVAEGGGGVVVNNHFNIAANGDASVKQIVKGMMPQITAATKSAVVDARRRGGNYGKAFN